MKSMVADERTGGPKTLTVEQALARMRTYVEEPDEETQAEFIAAALAFVDRQCPENLEAMRAAAQRLRAEQVERVQTASGSFGCAIDADRVRDELRAASMIVEVEGVTMSGVMLRARGCYIAYKDADGRWRGVCSSPPEVSAP